MIQSFGTPATEDIFNGRRSKAALRIPQELHRAAQRKLLLLDSAAQLTYLNLPPSNRLEALKGDLKGFYSIRINRQWRIIFRFENGQAYDVEITDYH